MEPLHQTTTSSPVTATGAVHVSETSHTTPTESHQTESHQADSAVTNTSHAEAGAAHGEVQGEAHAETGHHFMQPQPDTIFRVGGIGITNAVLAMCLVVVGLSIFFIALRPTLKLIPGRIQSALETLLEFFMSAMTQAYGSEEKARKFVPWIMTLFILIGVMNQFMLLPFLGYIKVDGGSHFFRLSTSDWSLTIALALASIIGAQVIAFTINPLQHIGNYIKVGHLFHARTPMDFFMALVEIFIGLIEIIGELSKVVSLSARLFGNIFAGELMTAVVGVVAAYVVPMPFVALGIFVGFIQAFVFTFLTMLFMANTISHVHPRGSVPAHAH